MSWTEVKVDDQIAFLERVEADVKAIEDRFMGGRVVEALARQGIDGEPLTTYRTVVASALDRLYAKRAREQREAAATKPK